MKRSLDEVGDGAEATPAKRPHVDLEMDPAKSGEEALGDYILRNQNRSLNLDLANKRRVILEARKELELMHKKSREMEALVSLIQRAWSQLDIDASLLLDSLGDPEAVISERGSSDMLHRFLHISSKYYKLDPTHEDNLPTLEGVDDYTTESDINKAVEDAEQSLKENGKDDTEEGKALEEHLTGHVSFTLNLLERLCNAITDSNILANIPEQTQQNIVQIKENYSKIMFMSDEIVKLKGEIIGLHAKLKTTENLNVRLNKKIDRLQATIKTLQERKVQCVADVTGNNDEGEIAQISNGSNSEANEVMKALEHKIKVLERQLAESETAKANVEMKYTERISRPVGHSEGQIQDMRKAMEELRSQCKQRVTAITTENESLQEKVKDLTLALHTLETQSLAKIETFFKETSSTLEQHQTQIKSLQDKNTLLLHYQVECEELKKTMKNYQQLKEVSNKERQRLANELKHIQTVYDRILAHSKSSKQREEALEQLIVKHKIESDIAIDYDKFKDIIDIDSYTNPYEQVLTHLSNRVEELVSELNDARNTINDLILEIDSMSSSTTAVYEQNEMLNRQLTDIQALRHAVLEENIQLTNQMEGMKESQKDSQQKTEGIKKQMTNQEALLSQVRAEENCLSTSLHTAQKQCASLQSKKLQSENQVAECKQQMKDMEHQLQSAKKKNEELSQRCQELVKQSAQERKARQAAEREVQQQKKQSNLSSSSNAMSQDDADMLEMTLNMLKCSVCKDRFKTVAITRCYHLFCRECIEESIRNRSRKCPACGEKFGQDDVATVYFTH